jgi:hypothetical protein
MRRETYAATDPQQRHYATQHTFQILPTLRMDERGIIKIETGMASAIMRSFIYFAWQLS